MLGSHRPGSGGWMGDGGVKLKLIRNSQDLTLKKEFNSVQGEEHVETESKGGQLPGTQ